jgi:hypothetical protein
MLQQHTKEHKMTKEELVAQCLADNPVMTQTNNNIERELSEEERIEAANAWADMRLEQIAHEAELAAQAAAEEAAKQQAFNDAVAAAVAAALAAQQEPVVTQE